MIGSGHGIGQDGIEVMAIVMESSYSIDAGANLIRLKVWGELTADSLMELLNQARADPEYVPGMHAVADYREAYGSWDYSEIQRFRDYLVHIAVPAKCAGPRLSSRATWPPPRTS